MSAEARKVDWPKFSPIWLGFAIPTLFFIFRFTAAAAFLIFFLLFITFQLHQSRRSLLFAFALFLAAILIPLDVYVPGFDGPLCGIKHSGPRFVRVMWGMPRIQQDLNRYGEFVSGGCLVGIYETRWMLVLN